MPTQTVHVPHLGGIDAAYQMPSYDAKKPTCILINSMTTSSDLYKAQFESKQLTNTMNLLAIEPLGHGDTRCKLEHFTYWDTAYMNLLVMDALGIKQAFALGTSQGGWIVVRMALLAPEKMLGILPLGTSMSAETPHTRDLGCWDATANLEDKIARWTPPVDSTWVAEDDWCHACADLGFGETVPQSLKDFWFNKLKETYRGDDGRKRIRMAAICLLERDGLRTRCGDVKCPVLWLHGTNDIPFNIQLPKEEIELFTGSVDARLKIVEGGAHYLSASHPKEVEGELIEFVKKYSK